MKSQEFAQRYYLEGCLDDAHLVERYTTAHALGALGCSPDIYSEYSGMTYNQIGQLFTCGMSFGDYTKQYTHGEYVPEKEGGKGNPMFRFLSYSMFPMWLGLQEALNADEQLALPPYKAVEASMGRLRALGAEMLFIRHRTLASRFRGSRQEYVAARSETSNLEGMINEVDTALVLANVALQQQVWVLPAPPIFERKRGLKADFLVIDPTKQKAVGVQAKLYSIIEEVEQYQNPADGVILSWGVRDLDNYFTAYVPDNPRNSKNPNQLFPYAGNIVNICNKYCEGRSAISDNIRRGNRQFDKFLLTHYPSKVLKAKDKARLFESYQRKTDAMWQRISSALSS